jgi:PhoPQ-activated pathogenicity-related protein
MRKKELTRTDRSATCSSSICQLDHVSRRRSDLSIASILICFSCFFAANSSWSADNALAAYVARADPTSGWREVASGRFGTAEYAEYLLTSQTWRGIAWKHQLFVVKPANMPKDAHTALLYIDGGRWRPEYDGERKQAQPPSEAMIFGRLAEAIASPIVILRQVPFAPIFDRREDALIAYTFDQYLQTGEDDWPLLLPMVKSAVRGMDAVQAIARERWNVSIDAFTVTGASKRGWTTWLTAATDKRVMALAPMVIDVLNMRVQMQHQQETWGTLSDEIRDYSAIDLPARLGTARGAALLAMVDPYQFREHLTQPKLILLSTNDRYWPLDALKFYWPDLSGPKHVLYLPNQGHDLRDFERVIGGLAALHRYTASGKRLPESRWSFNATSDALSIRVATERTVRSQTIWSAYSSTRDFREARWSSRDCATSKDGHICTTARDGKQYTAAYAETSYQDEGAPAFSTTTTVCIVAPTAASGVNDASGC